MASAPPPRASDTPSAEAFTPLLGRILGTAPAAVLLLDRDRRVVFANHGPRGEPADVLMGHALPEVVASEHIERLDAACKRAFAEGAAESFELGERGPAGAISWWRVDASPVGVERPEAALLMFTDVTARKREEERLRRSESLLVDAQGVAHLGTWEWDVSQPTATWSDELYRIYGLTPEEYAPSYEAYLQMVHPDDRQRVMDATNRVFHEHIPYSHDERIFRKDGTLRHLHTWAMPVLDETGKLVRLLGVCQDITEQKRAEGAMRSQTMTRTLARRLLHDLMQRANVPDSIVRDLGRALAQEHALGSMPAYTDAFTEMGFGALHFESAQGGRYAFRASDLLEKRGESALPTCFLTLGYLEGAVRAMTGRPALGNEMRCQSMGHEECRFVVMTQ